MNRKERILKQLYDFRENIGTNYKISKPQLTIVNNGPH